MAEGRGKLEWAQTSSLMALIVNITRDPRKSTGAKPADFNPYYRKRKPTIKVPASVLRDVWCRRKDGE